MRNYNGLTKKTKNHFRDKANRYIMSVDMMKSITDFSIIVEHSLTIAKVDEEDKKRIINIIENERKRGIARLNYELDEILFLMNLLVAGDSVWEDSDSKDDSNMYYIPVDYRKLAKLYCLYELEKDENGKHQLKEVVNIDKKMYGGMYKRFDKLIESLGTKKVIRVMYNTEKKVYEVCFEPVVLSLKLVTDGLEHKKGTENILRDKTRRVYKIFLHPAFVEQLFFNHMLKSYKRTELVATLNQLPAPVQRLILTFSGSPNNASLTYKQAYRVAYNVKDDNIDKRYVSKFKKKCIEYKDILQDWGIEAREDGVIYKIASEDAKLALYNPTKELDKLEKQKKLREKNKQSKK